MILPAAENLSPTITSRRHTRSLSCIRRGLLLLAFLASVPLLIWSLPGWSYWLASLQPAKAELDPSQSAAQESLSGHIASTSQPGGSSSVLLAAGANLLRLPAESSKLFDMTGEAAIEVIERSHVMRALAADWPTLERLGARELWSMLIAGEGATINDWSWMIWTIELADGQLPAADTWHHLELSSGAVRYRFFTHDQQNFCLLERVSLPVLPEENIK